SLDFDPILIELPGHGDAEDWDRSRDFSDQAIEIALDRMPSEPIPLIGHSFGAVLALRLAVERPYRVSSLVLIEPVFYAAVAESYLFDKLRRDMAPFEGKVRDGSHAMATKTFVQNWGSGEDWDDIPETQRRYLVDRIEHVLAGEELLWEDPPGLLREGRIEALEMPVTLVEGETSHPIITTIVDALGARMPDAEGITVPGAGHMVPLTHPMPVAEAVRDRLVW
ncbi:MAG: alpha/beta fold hydrolase, partial [Boseongicola sp.]